MLSDIDLNDMTHMMTAEKLKYVHTADDQHF